MKSCRKVGFDKWIWAKIHLEKCAWKWYFSCWNKNMFRCSYSFFKSLPRYTPSFAVQRNPLKKNKIKCCFFFSARAFSHFLISSSIWDQKGFFAPGWGPIFLWYEATEAIPVTRNFWTMFPVFLVVSWVTLTSLWKCESCRLLRRGIFSYKKLFAIGQGEENAQFIRINCERSIHSPYVLSRLYTYSTILLAFTSLRRLCWFILRPFCRFFFLRNHIRSPFRIFTNLWIILLLPLSRVGTKLQIKFGKFFFIPETPLWWAATVSQIGSLSSFAPWLRPPCHGPKNAWKESVDTHMPDYRFL